MTTTLARRPAAILDRGPEAAVVAAQLGANLKLSTAVDARRTIGL